MMPTPDPDEEFSITLPDHPSERGWFLARYDLGRCATCVCRIFKGDWARSVDAGVVCEPCGESEP